MANPKIKYDFNPFALTGESSKGVQDKDALLSEIADFVVNRVRDSAAQQKSSVSGRGKWKRLTSDYADAKKGGSRTANLRLSSEMLDSLSGQRLRGNTVRVEVGSSQQRKADGHNNFSGKSKLPERRFIPNDKDKETWNRAVIDGIKQLIKESKN